MPSSVRDGKVKIAKWINDRIDSPDFRILDLGCGRGTYGRLITKPCYKVGIDAMPYAEKFGLSEFYNDFYQLDIRKPSKLKLMGEFDLAILGDVLEHMYPDQARNVLNSLETHCKAILIAVPFLYWQINKKNPWENHLQPDLTESVFAQRYPEFKVHSLYYRKEKPWNGNAFYGYYIWERSA